MTHKTGGIEVKSGDNAFKVRDVIRDLVGGRVRPGALSMTAQIEREYAVRPRQRRGNMVPPMGMGRAAVKQDERGIRCFAPFQVMQGKVSDMDKAARGGMTHGH